MFTVNSFPNQIITWNPSDNFGMTLSNDNLDAEESQSGLVGVRATVGKITDKWYAEYPILASASGADIFIGLVLLGQALDTNINGNYRVAWRGNGTILFNGAAIGTTQAFGASDIAGLALNAGTQNVWLNLNNGAWLGGGDPAAGTTPTGTYTGSGAVFPFYKSDNITSDLCKVGIRGNTGNQTYSPPSGYTPFGG